MTIEIEDDMAKRIQRKRTKGWRMPENTVYVGRPTIWGNPFSIDDLGLAGSIRIYSIYMYHKAQKDLRNKARRELSGKDLACWCPENQVCHADVLLKIANSEIEG